MRRAKLPATAWAVLLVGIGLTVLAACGDNASTPSPTATDAAPAASPTSPLEPTAPAEFEGGRKPVEGTLSTGPTDEPLGTLVDVRAAEHEGFDRIVFEFSGTPPNYRVEYVDEAIACGSGEPVEVEGAVFLQFRFTAAQAHDEQGQATVDFTQTSPQLPSGVFVVQTCDFEDDVTWVLGLPGELDFRASPVDGPPRLVVDVAHP